MAPKRIVLNGIIVIFQWIFVYSDSEYQFLPLCRSVIDLQRNQMIQYHSLVQRGITTCSTQVLDISATLLLSFYVSCNPFILQEENNDTNPLTSACCKCALPLKNCFSLLMRRHRDGSESLSGSATEDLGEMQNCKSSSTNRTVNCRLSAAVLISSGLIS